VSAVDLAKFALGLLSVLQGVAMVSSYWTVAAECLWQCTRVHDVSGAQLVRVTPVAHRGKATLCAIVKGDDGVLRFEFQKRTFKLDAARGVWLKPRYPVDLPLSQYLSALGYTAEAPFKAALARWGPNMFDIPLPSFTDLYIEQATAPFFVFQVLCVMLWLLDEYWTYSCFTLLLLLVFEGTVVKSRLRNLGTLRQMAEQPPRPVYVFRAQKWQQALSTHLLPGDIVSVSRVPKPKDKDGQVIAGVPDLSFVPCDAVLLRGACVVNEAMLTGESTPKMKEAAKPASPTEVLDMVAHRRSMLFAGTTVLQSTPPAGADAKWAPPDGGAVAFVLRTSFETSQGKLLRMILFGTERITANTWEAFRFIFVLLAFALVASAYVLVNGLQDESRSKWKLFLNCTMIITSVVPPELPMELSLAVNTSLVNLVRDGIFCTEPYRIPLAGKVQICCFDKTGTLTRSNLRLLGLAGAPSASLKPADVASKSGGGGDGDDDDDDDGAAASAASEADLVQPVDINPLSPASIVISGCHALAMIEDELIGDPLEAASLSACGWSLTDAGRGAKHNEGTVATRVVQRNHFSSTLKRMSTVCELSGAGVPATMSHYVALVKGAPETIGNMLADKPAEFDRAYQFHSLKGRRVLALAYKALPQVSSAARAAAIPRSEVESGLTFAGMLVFSCPPKSDARRTMRDLRESSHMLMMITGDATLTAAAVAADLGLVDKPVAVLRGAEWQTVAGARLGDADAYGDVAREHALCVSGEELGELLARADGTPRRLLPLVSVFARTSPSQKERVLSTLKEAGFATLMCGDGTNDVGALKQADVGVAVLNRGPQPKKKRVKFGELTSEAKKQVEEKLRKKREEERKKNGGAYEGARERRIRELQERLARDEPPPPALGDASIASSFTSKWTNVAPIANIIRQGRSTLVTTLQMYKILALNCLVTAYCLSVLYLKGVKLGDTQMTITGVLVAFCFLFISRSKPAETAGQAAPAAEHLLALRRLLGALPDGAAPLGAAARHGASPRPRWRSRRRAPPSPRRRPSSTSTATSCARPSPPPPRPPPSRSTPTSSRRRCSTASSFCSAAACRCPTLLPTTAATRSWCRSRRTSRCLFGLIAVAFVSFFCASEFAPKLNEAFDLVPLPVDSVSHQHHRHDGHRHAGLHLGRAGGATSVSLVNAHIFAGRHANALSARV
jgi:cation-transporting ATPase 13A1